MLKAFLVSSFLGAVLVLSQAPWDNFLVIYLVLPALLLNLEYSVKGNTIYKRSGVNDRLHKNAKILHFNFQNRFLYRLWYKIKLKYLDVSKLKDSS